MTPQRCVARRRRCSSGGHRPRSRLSLRSASARCTWRTGRSRVWTRCCRCEGKGWKGLCWAVWEGGARKRLFYVAHWTGAARKRKRALLQVWTRCCRCGRAAACRSHRAEAEGHVGSGGWRVWKRCGTACAMRKKSSDAEDAAEWGLVDAGEKGLVDAGEKGLALGGVCMCGREVYACVEGREEGSVGVRTR
eukprot:224337-Chlamydomonas_euryale.AAC.2